MQSEEINAFNNLPNKEKEKYIGVDFNTITNIHSRKKSVLIIKILLILVNQKQFLRINIIVILQK